MDGPRMNLNTLILHLTAYLIHYFYITQKLEVTAINGLQIQNQHRKKKQLKKLKRI